MTIAELSKRATSGMQIKRADSARAFTFGPGKGKPFLLVDVYGNAASLFSDDLAADDWEALAFAERATVTWPTPTNAPLSFKGPPTTPTCKPWCGHWLSDVPEMEVQRMGYAIAYDEAARHSRYFCSASCRDAGHPLHPATRPLAETAAKRETFDQACGTCGLEPGTGLVQPQDKGFPVPCPTCQGQQGPEFDGDIWCPDCTPCRMCGGKGYEIVLPGEESPCPRCRPATERR